MIHCGFFRATPMCSMLTTTSFSCILIVVQVPGHIHILNNVLKEALESLPITVNYLQHLRAIQNFLSDKSLRRAIQARCVTNAAVRPVFDAYSTVHIDRKWEFLTKALNKLVPLLPHFIKWFDASKLQDKVEGGMEAGQTAAVHRILSSEPFLAETYELFRIMTNIADAFAGKLGTCWWHESTWAKGRVFQAAPRRVGEADWLRTVRVEGTHGAMVGGSWQGNYAWGVVKVFQRAS